MTNKLVVVINSLKVPKIKKILLYEMKCLVPNYSCLQNPWLGGLAPPDPRSFCPQLNLNPPPQTKFLGTPLNNPVPHPRILKPQNLTLLKVKDIVLITLSFHAWHSKGYTLWQRLQLQLYTTELLIVKKGHKSLAPTLTGETKRWCLWLLAYLTSPGLMGHWQGRIHRGGACRTPPAPLKSLTCA